ncbi:MAG: zinc ribbon domain-containing protein [Verrucomicrobiales bacterium]|nr:zinc ribbon domain-containing protein [Verrucomicrobiales bacterium]MCP5559984.1 zinc ribbon domain-containing protein [Verrucomicrobiaceae bacterium]
MASSQVVGCSACGAEIIDGQSFCGHCGALQFMDESISQIARKVKFSQQKLRDSFPEHIRKHFRADEFLHAHTYGPKHYYVLSNRRLYIGAISSKGVFTKKYELSVLQRTVDLERATQLKTWSELFYDRFDQYAEVPFMSLQVETFDGDFDVTVYAFGDRAPFFCDPHYFEMKLQDVLQNLQNKFVDAEEALWLSPSFPPPLPPPLPQM